MEEYSSVSRRGKNAHVIHTAVREGKPLARGGAAGLGSPSNGWWWGEGRPRREKMMRESKQKVWEIGGSGKAKCFH